MAGTARESAYKKKRNAWREILFDLKGADGDSVAQKRLGLLEGWRASSWAYLSGRDVPTEEFRTTWPHGRPIIWTVDERDDENPVKPFPAYKEYLRDLDTELWKYRLYFVDKVRQMYITTLLALELDWYAAFHDEREIIVSRLKEDSAIKLINDKIRTVQTRKPYWLQQVMALTEQPKNVITYVESGSTVTGVAQNFGDGDARGITASVVMVDEAAYQDMFPQIYRGVLPMATRLWAVSTANVGNPGAALFRQIVMEGRPGGNPILEQGEEEGMSAGTDS